MRLKTKAIVLLVAAALLSAYDLSHAADLDDNAVDTPAVIATAETPRWMHLPDIDYSVVIPAVAVGATMLLVAKSHRGTSAAPVAEGRPTAAGALSASTAAPLVTRHASGWIAPVAGLLAWPVARVLYKFHKTNHACPSMIDELSQLSPSVTPCVPRASEPFGWSGAIGDELHEMVAAPLALVQAARTVVTSLMPGGTVP